MRAGTAGEGSDGIVLVAANDALCRATGLSHEGLVGRPLASLAAASGDPASCDEIMHAALEHRSIRSELLCDRQTGPPFWLDST